ncbi:MAG: FxsA family protein [bacterium]|nr:FxsA family protein [bacterium]
MFGKLLLLFITVPFIELLILLDIGNSIGLGSTVILIVVTGFIGAYLAKMEGFRTFTMIQSKLQTGELPTDELIDGLIILIAGVVLITPGVLTDTFGFLMLFRPTRTRFKKWLKDRFSGHITMYSGGPTNNFSE